ncbi:hypothetical protein BC832DRAFT_551963 [Gaertneriomyces semiglobifer]|nr:hypothetical protein BC832DRAFT_551963 [Gaertneriomyces semiglobifer]
MVHYSLRNVPSGVYPLFAVMGVAVAGVFYVAARRSQNPDVVWSSRSNPTPWNTVKQDEQVKLYDPHGRYQKTWSRHSSGKADEAH